MRGSRLEVRNSGLKLKGEKKTYFKHIHISVDTVAAGVNPTPVDTLPLSVKHTDVFKAGHTAPLHVFYSRSVKKNIAQDKHTHSE